MKREKPTMISLDTLLLKAAVEAIKDLVVLTLHPFQIFLKISSAILVEEALLESSNRGNDLRYDVSIDLEEAFKDIQKNVKYTTYKACSSCSGSGAEKVQNLLDVTTVLVEEK